MNSIEVITKVKEYILDQVNSLAKTNPIINFTKPLVTRIIDNNIDKADKMLSLLADNNGNIDVENILNEMIGSVVDTKTFTVHNSFIGDINIGDGKIVLNIPFMSKSLVFNTEDIENLKNTLINK